MFIDELIQELVSGMMLKYNKIDDNLYRLDGVTLGLPDKSRSRNPCAEIILRSEIWLKVADGIVIVEDCLHYNLSDPNSIDELIMDFRNLDVLKTKISKAYTAKYEQPLW